MASIDEPVVKANTRVLPSWGSSSVSSNTGSRGSTKKPPSSKKESALNTQKPQSSKVYKNSRWYTVRHDNHKKAFLNHGSDSVDQLPQKDAKRMLPSYLQNPSSSSSSPSLQRHESYPVPASSSQTKFDFHPQDNYIWAHNDLAMKNNHGSRLLPPSMKPPVSVPSTAHYAGQSGHSRPGIVEETVGDERLIYQVALRDLYQPTIEATLPYGLLSIPLFKHQKIALAWMLDKENSVACSGGILADDQGLGKTISVIALIQMQRFSSKPKLEDPCGSEAEDLDVDDDNDKGIMDEDSDERKLITKVKSSRSEEEFHSRKPQGGSLVVCPASVLRQWAHELDEKVADEAKLEVLIYHGLNRTHDPDELAKYDVVLTTYSIVAREVPTKAFDDDDDDDDDDEFGNKKRKQSHVSKKGKKKGKKGKKGKGALAKVNWFRVILDEAQTIKNFSTQVSNSCCGLRAKKRWCLSGTPIQNSIDELFSYFRFLKCEPYSNYKSFCNLIKTPMSKNTNQGNKKLQAVLKTIMLRRTKDTLINGKPIINLPPKTIKLKAVDFSKEERAFYLKLEAESRSQYKAYQAAGTVRQNYANILLMLLRLRQACDHPLLVKGFSSESVSQDSKKVTKNLPKDTQVKLLKLLETLNICLLCSDPPEYAVVTICGHVFCQLCLSEYLTGDEFDNTCPSFNCKTQIGDDVVFSKATLRSCVHDDGGDDDDDDDRIDDESCLVFENDYASSKVKATLEIIQTHCSRSNIKAIVFSQWTRMLDLVEASLSQHCIEYRRLDGSMSLVSRDMAVKEFNTDPEVIVMLMSLKAGNVGLNMVAASHVILLDLWWNPATEDQAIDRAHRIGQTRPVTVSRLTIKDTVEDRILALQEEKRKMISSAFGEDQSGSSGPRLTAQDLKYLFMGSH